MVLEVLGVDLEVLGGGPGGPGGGRGGLEGGTGAPGGHQPLDTLGKRSLVRGTYKCARFSTLRSILKLELSKPSPQQHAGSKR